MFDDVAPALVVLWDHVFRAEGAKRWRVYRGLVATLAVLLMPMLSETQGRTVVSRLLGYTPKAAGDTWTAWSYLWTQAGVTTPATRRCGRTRCGSAPATRGPGSLRDRLDEGMRYADAETQMRAALPLKMDPETEAQAHLQLGSPLAAQRRFDEGIATVERALAIDPSIKEADPILGQVYADQGKDGRALERQPGERLPSHARGMAARDLARPGGPRRRPRRGPGRTRHPGVSGTGTGRVRDGGGRLRRARPAGRRGWRHGPRDRPDARPRRRAETPLSEQQRAFYAAGGRVAAASR